MLLTLLSCKAFTAVFLYYLKASLSPIYTGGMNLSIYSTRMPERQESFALGLGQSCTIHSGELDAKGLLMQTHQLGV